VTTGSPRLPESTADASWRSPMRISSAMTSLIDRFPSWERWRARSWRSSGRSIVVRTATSYHHCIMMRRRENQCSHGQCSHGQFGDDVLATARHAGLLGKVGEQVELLGGEFNDGIVEVDGAGATVDPQ